MTMEKRNTVETGRTPEKQIKECKAGTCKRCVQKKMQKKAAEGTGSITDTDNLSKEFDK